MNNENDNINVNEQQIVQQNNIEQQPSGVEPPKKKSKKGLIIFIIILILGILGAISYNCYNKYYVNKEKKQTTKKTTKKTETTKENEYIDITEETKTKIMNFINATSNKIFINSPIIDNFDNNFTEEQKMGISLYTYYGKIVGFSCSQDNGTETLSINSLPTVFNDMSFINSYKEGKHKSTSEFLALRDKYQEASIGFKGGIDAPYVIRIEGDNIYIGNRYCGAEGPNSKTEIKFISGKENDEEIIVNLKYAYLKVEVANDGLIYKMYPTYDGQDSESLAEYNTSEVYNGTANIDYNKLKEYTLKFKKNTNGFTLTSIEKQD